MVKKRSVLALLLSGTILLTGCSSLLNRSYTTVAPHSAAPTVESDQLTIRVETYQSLVNALLYFITQGRSEGTIRLYNYPYDVEKDMAAACREVAVEDPLGAYAVSYISYDISPIVSCYEATVKLHYRRSHEQVENVVSLSGPSAIRSHLQGVLSSFEPETAMHISYFNAEEDGYILSLLKQAYYASPESALGMPEAVVSLYPDTGRQRIVEVELTYPLPTDILNQRKAQLSRHLQRMSEQLWSGMGDKGLLAIRQAVLDQAEYSPEGGSTAYSALLENKADSQGLALTVAALCQRLDYPCHIVEGTLDGEHRFWNIVSTQDGNRHLDLSNPGLLEQELPFLSDQTLFKAGYHWNRDLYPPCGTQPEETAEVN